MPFYKKIDDYCGLWNLEQCGSIGRLQRPLPGPKMFSILCSFLGDLAKSYVGAPPLEVWRPLLQEVCWGVSARGCLPRGWGCLLVIGCLPARRVSAQGWCLRRGVGVSACQVCELCLRFNFLRGLF